MQAQQRVKIPMRDGFALGGYEWKQPQPATVVLLLHQCDFNQSMYTQLAAALHAKGFHVISVDYRGTGESATGDFRQKNDEQDRAFWNRVEKSSAHDMEDVWRFVQRIPHQRSAILGASCGGNKAVALAKAHTEIEALGFLSCRLSERSVSDVKNLNVPKLFVTAEGDKRAYEAAREVLRSDVKDPSAAFYYAGAAHGYPLFDQDPELIGKICNWYSDVLK